MKHPAPFARYTKIHWRPFRTVLSAAEAAEAAAYCLFSLATLEIGVNSATANFALIEEEHPGVWRWAVVSPEGFVLCDRRAPTQAKAKKCAEAGLVAVAA